MSANLLTERAGYSKGYYGRLPKKLLNPKADVGHRTLERLCEITKNDFCWLCTGKGWPNEETRELYEGAPPERASPGQSDMLPKSPFGDLEIEGPAPRRTARRRAKR